MLTNGLIDSRNMVRHKYGRVIFYDDGAVVFFTFTCFPVWYVVRWTGKIRETFCTVLFGTIEFRANQRETKMRKLHTSEEGK